jgi:aspartate carbamoyltransferase regulatory subunit
VYPKIDHINKKSSFNSNTSFGIYNRFYLSFVSKKQTIQIEVTFGHEPDLVKRTKALELENKKLAKEEVKKVVVKCPKDHECIRFDGSHPSYTSNYAVCEPAPTGC